MALPRNSATLVPRSGGGQTRPIRGLESGLPTVVGVVEAQLRIKSCDRNTSAEPSPGKSAPGSAEHGEMALKTARFDEFLCHFGPGFPEPPSGDDIIDGIGGIGAIGGTRFAPSSLASMSRLWWSRRDNSRRLPAHPTFRSCVTFAPRDGSFVTFCQAFFLPFIRPRFGPRDALHPARHGKRNGSWGVSRRPVERIHPHLAVGAVAASCRDASPPRPKVARNTKDCRLVRVQSLRSLCNV